MDDESIQQAAAEAASENQGDELRDAIKQVTLKALSERQLDKENMKVVVEQVITGVSKNFSDSSERLKPAMESSLRGVDDALAKSALAAKLATEEVLAKSEKFINNDVKKVISDLKATEDILFESLAQVASNSTELASSILMDLSDHLKQSGTSAGSSALEAIQTLTSAIESTGKQGIAEVSHASRDVAINLARITSGILAGMSEAINSRKKS